MTTDATDHPHIERLELVGRRGRRVRLVPDRGEALEVALDVVEELELYAGAALTPKVLHRLAEADGKWKARQDALNLLSYRPRSEQELRRRLRKKNHAPAVVEWCIDRLCTEGFLDDRAFAEAHARSRLRLKPRGRRKLMQELRKKGVQREVADAAIDSALEEVGTDELTLTREVARSWLNRQSDSVWDDLGADFGADERERARRRLMGYLKRRGFPLAAVRTVMEEVQREAEEKAAE